ncbi:MAG: hypothetical protein ICV83_17555 [Cytophagales bacterium]|nr:hypothetical protein [Cytophagales bacterium]
MKTINHCALGPGLMALPLLAAAPARAAGMGEAVATPGGLVLLLVLGIALVLAGVIGYVLRLLAGLGGPSPSRRDASGVRPTGPETFAPYLEELDGPQLDALQQLHDSASLPTLFTHDHAKEQLV